jgi:P-type E1-E2 ATPase
VGQVEGVTVALGNAKLMAREAPNAAWLAATADAVAARGSTPVAAARGGAALAVFGLQDPPRPEAAAVVAALRGLGVRTLMLSGDRTAAADAVGRALGLDEVRAELTPEDKVAAVRALLAGHGPVAMVGDGLNDAPALAAADVGVAVGAGTDVAKEAGDLVLVRDDLGDVVRAIRLGRATLRNIRQNLFWALAYNLAMVPAAAFGWVHPGLAGAAMALSSLSVVLNALRLGRADVG